MQEIGSSRKLNSVKDIRDTLQRNDEMIEMGKQGKTKLSDVAKAWGCSTLNIASYLHRLQESKNLAYLVDGRGYFRIFMDFK